jgi:hypothetical protein
MKQHEVCVVLGVDCREVERLIRLSELPYPVTEQALEEYIARERLAAREGAA